MLRFNRRKLGLAVLFILLALVVRLPGLGQFMTADEENWTLRSSYYWHNLWRNHDTGGAFMTTHPGATAMWIIGSGVVVQEARLGFDADTSNLRYFRLAATLPIAIATALLVGVSVSLLATLAGYRVAAWSGLLLATNPYLVGLSQIAHLDALLALFMLNAAIAFMVGWQQNHTRWLVVGGIFTGLAFATKLLPALWLLVFLGGLLIVKYRTGWRLRLHPLISAGLLVFGIAMLTFYATWPALWLTDDISRSFARDVPSVLTDAHIATEESEEPVAPVGFYWRTILGRSTPLILIMGLAGIVTAMRASWRQKAIHPLIALFAYTVGYTILITFVAKKGDRYALPALLALTVMAGWALSAATTILATWLNRRSFQVGVTTVVVLLLIAEVGLWSPYAIAYNNPFLRVRPATQQGWGEGLDEAARWLNQHPFIDNLTVASWYPSVMRPYFNGKTMSLSARDDHRVGFVVTYRNMYGRAPDDIASDVLDEYRDKKPEHIVYIQGEPYVWIYNTLGPRYFRQHVGELVAGVEIGQVIPIEQPDWNTIDVGLATFSGRANTEDIILTVRASPDSSEVIREVTVNARQVQDEDWQTFKFEPIADSAGKTYYVSLTSPDSTAGNAITARFVEQDVMPGQMLLRRQALEAGEKNSDFMRAGDIAYRL